MVTKTCESRLISEDSYERTTIFRVRCLSTDTKPTSGMTNGSTLVEIDTGKKYMFNVDSEDWIDHGVVIGDGDDAEY